MDLNTTEYNDIIKRIKIKRTIARILIFITAALLILSFPIQLKFNGEIIFDYKGFQSPALFFIIVAFVAELIAHIIICLPIYNSLFEECNAQKNVIMLNALDSEKRACHLFYTAYFYLGDFDTSIYYSNKAIENKTQSNKLAGLFNKARCEFFSDRIEDFKRTVSEFDSLFANAKFSKRQTAIISKYQNVINLLSAILNKDNEKIKEFTIKLQPWEDTKIVNSFINYLKGVASYELGDKKESTYRFMAVCDVASKTVLGELSEKYLSEINKEKNTQEN